MGKRKPAKQFLIALLLLGFASTGFSAGLTPYVYGAGTLGSATTDITPGLPTGTQLNDILILVVQSSNQAITAPAGWTEIDSQASMGTGTAVNAGSFRVAVFWKRATASESAPTVTDTGDHTIGKIYGFRNCVTTGNPWDVESVALQTTTNTALSWVSAGITYGSNGGTVTSTVDNCLVLGIIGHAVDSNTSQASAETFTTVGAATELTGQDNSTTNGTGGGFAVVGANQTSAGNIVNTSTNDFSATLAATSKYSMMVLALKPQTNVPYVVSTNNNTNIGNVAVTFTCVANDIILLFVESANEAISAPSGYTEIDTQANMGNGTGGAAGSTRLGVFWKLATGSETTVTVTDSGDHTMCTVVVVRGAILTGNPWDAESGGVQATTNTAVSWQSAGFSYSTNGATITTTGSNRLILSVVTNATDGSSAQLSAQAFTNTNVYDVLEESDVDNIANNGGGIAITSARLESAGTFLDSGSNNFTATLGTTSKYAMFFISIKPPTTGLTAQQKAAFFMIFP